MGWLASVRRAGMSKWGKALVALDTLALDPEVVDDPDGILFKQRDDVAALTHELASELLKPEEVE